MSMTRRAVTVVAHSLPQTGGGDVVTLIDGNRQRQDTERETSGRAFSRLARCNAIVQKHPSSEKSKKDLFYVSRRPATNHVMTFFFLTNNDEYVNNYIH